MRLKIATKIWLGFAAILLAFASAVFYGARNLQHFSDELRLVSKGYVQLRLSLSELQTTQNNLIRVLQDLAEQNSYPRHLKFALDDARRTRLEIQLKELLATTEQLAKAPASPAERSWLQHLHGEFSVLRDEVLQIDQRMYDPLLGAIGDEAAIDSAGPFKKWADQSDQLIEQEQNIKRTLAILTTNLRLHNQQSMLQLEVSEDRALWVIVMLVGATVLVGLGVTVIATRSVRPLRLLVDQTQRIARGEYRSGAPIFVQDELGELAQAFTAMELALQDREQRLIRSEQLAAVGKMAALIAHEIRNPLSSIQLNAEMLQDELVQGIGNLADQKNLIGAIVHESNRLTQITEEYLLFSRLPKPKLQFEDLGQLLTNIVDFVRPEFDRKSIELSLQKPAAGIQLSIDEQQLRQVILNLLRNSSDSQEAGGRIEITIGERDTFASISVRDWGHGISAEHLKSIFEPFFSTKVKGTGLGLAIAQQIIHQHGGTIEVSSAPGEGSTFVIVLPLQTHAKNISRARPPSQNSRVG